MKLIPKCQNNSGNAFGNMGKTIHKQISLQPSQYTFTNKNGNDELGYWFKNSNGGDTQLAVNEDGKWRTVSNDGKNYTTSLDISFMDDLNLVGENGEELTVYPNGATWQNNKTLKSSNFWNPSNLYYGFHTNLAADARNYGLKLDKNDPNASHSTDYDPGLYFTMNEKEQYKNMRDLGYFLAPDLNDFGLVNRAATMSRKNGNKVPIYQMLKDAIDRNKLKVIYNGNNNDLNEVYKTSDDMIFSGASKKLVHALNYPLAIYLDPSTHKYYYQAWDLNDYGDTSTGNEGTKYGSKQFYANLYNRMGTPFVQKTGIVELPNLEGKFLPSEVDQKYQEWLNSEDYNKTLENKINSALHLKGSIFANKGYDYTKKEMIDLLRKNFKHNVVPFEVNVKL